MKPGRARAGRGGGPIAGGARAAACLVSILIPILWDPVPACGEVAAPSPAADPAPRGPEAPACEPPPRGWPPAPGIGDLDLTAEETERLLAGETVVKTVSRTADDRMARALKLLDPSPVELFGVTSDSRLQREMFEEMAVFEEIALCPDGKKFRGVADVSWILPDFHYTNRSLYNRSGTGMTWTQLHGDFDRNDGSWVFFWYPAGGKTLAVLTLDLAFRGILSLVPEGFILYLTKHNLPRTLDRIVWMAGEVRKRDQARAAAWDAEWAALKPRIESGDVPQAPPWMPGGAAAP